MKRILDSFSEVGVTTQSMLVGGIVCTVLGWLVNSFILGFFAGAALSYYFAVTMDEGPNRRKVKRTPHTPKAPPYY